MMSWQRTARWTAVVLLTVAVPVWATEWVADFTSVAPESWISSDSTAVANYADTGGGNPNSYTIVFDQTGAVAAGWLTQGTRGGTATTARFLNAVDGGSGRARFATPLPTSMDANGGISFAWTARYGDYLMGRAPIQLAFYDDGTSTGTAYNVFFRVQNGTELAILENGGAAYGNIDPLTIPSVADGLYHQWSCAVITSGGLAHGKLWLDGNLLLFTGTDGAHTFDAGSGLEQFSFQVATDGFTPITGPSGAYIGLGELNTTDVWEFEFDCVAFKDDGLAELTCGATPACESGVTPLSIQSSAAEQNGAATPAGIAYTFKNGGTGPVSYTVAETDAGGTAQDYTWLSLSKSGGGPIASGGSDVVTANIVDTSLAPGIYTAYVTFTDNCTPSVKHIRQIDLTITAPGIIRIDPNDDTTIRSGTNYNNSAPFGLFVKGSGDVSYIEFSLGVTPVTEAKLVLYEHDPGIANPWEIVVRGQEFNFDEATFTDTFAGSGWPLVGTIPNVLASDTFYEMDLTTWYNSNLGKTVTLFLTRDVQPAGDAPIFEDKEGTNTGDASTYGPRLEVIEGSLPACQSLVNPGDKQTATAFRNQPATPSSFQYDVVNAGVNSLSYTATELQLVAPAIADLYSTGVDSGRNALGAQVLDPHWTIIEGGLNGTCSAGVPCPAYTVIQDGFPIPPWIPNSSTSMWITPSPTDDDAIAPVGDHVYRTTFTVADPGSTVIRLRVSADDNLQSVLLNGVDTDPPITVATGTFTEWHEFAISTGFQAGVNTLDFRVGNGGVSPNPTGLHVEFFDIQAGDVPWLTLNPTSGGPITSGNSEVVTATIVDTDLPGGIHTAFISITDNCTPSVTHIREIELTVTDCLSQVSPAGDTGRSFLIGSAQTPAPVSYTFENIAVAPVSYSVATSGDCTWLQLDKNGGGPLGAGATDTVTGTIDPTGLAAGGHVCTLTFTDDCNPAVEHVRDVLLSVDESITGPPSGLQQFDAEFTTFTGTDLSAVSPLESCDPNVSTDREFSIGYNQVGTLPPGWLTQGLINGTPTTAKFNNPPDGNGGRVRFRTFLPFDSSFDPTKGMIVAWNMRVGSGDVIVRGPIQITFPRVPGPYATDNSISSIPGDVFTVYVRLQNGTDVRILNNGGGAIGTIDQYTLATFIADEYHQWTTAVCYNPVDQMAYWNLWLDGEKLMFGGGDGSVVGPGGDIFSFRTDLNDVTGDPYIGLGELNAGEDTWDFEFDWVRMVTLNVDGCPFWDGVGCIPEPECATPFADSDEDGDVDQLDFADFQLCFTGPNDLQGVYDAERCACFDRDGDDDIDTLDFEKFELCTSGPDVPWQSSPGCP